MIEDNSKLELYDYYGMTYEEMSAVKGDATASFFKTLYGKSKKKNKYFTIKVGKVLRGGNTCKYAFELIDGYSVETVCIKRKTGTTVCVSTMVGCPVQCVFCASGKNGFIRNLTASEIVQQVIIPESRINRIVFMGMGEPLLNYDNLIKAIHILRDRRGLDFPTDGITISTVGPIPQLKKLREEHLKIQLTLSLHSAIQKTRNKIIPHMAKYDVREVVESVLSYSKRHNRKVIIAYLLIPGMNDKEEDIKQIVRLLKGEKVLINLLQYNSISGFGLRRPNKQDLVSFKIRLEMEGLDVKIRESRGNGIKAACGQLVSRKNKRIEK